MRTKESDDERVRWWEEEREGEGEGARQKC